MVFEAKGLKIGHVNARSWLKKRDETFYVMRNIDVLGVSETWLNSTHTDSQICMDGYGMIRGDRKLGRKDNMGYKRGGGADIIYKE